MMMNITTEISSTNSLFRRYLLGESIKNIFIRLTVILSAIILVWCGIMCALIIHTKCQRTKQLSKNANTHHHLYDSTTSLTKTRSNRCKRNRRLNSSSCCCCCCCSIRDLFSQLKQRCGFWPSSSSSIANDISIQQIASITKTKQPVETIAKTIHSTPSRVQIVVETIAEPSMNINQNLPTIGKRISLYRGGGRASSTGDQLHNFHSSQSTFSSNQSLTQLAERKTHVHSPSISFPIGEIRTDLSTKRRLEKLHQFNTKATLFFHPVTRRLSNVKRDSCLPPTNTILQQQISKPLLMVSSARELTSDTSHDWQWHQSSIDEPTVTDTSRTSSVRHLPLVMITDTTSSNTNILELDTFEDRHRLVGDIERRLSRELRASYQPRHST